MAVFGGRSRHVSENPLGGITIRWSVHPQVLIDNLDSLQGRLINNAESASGRAAQDMEDWMKVNAPWQDQTHTARDGLYCVARTKWPTISFELGHGEETVNENGMNYGNFLEFGTVYMDPLPIIGPAQSEFGPRILDYYDDAME